MIDWLQTIDEMMFSALNGAHCSYADSVMWLATGRWAYFVLIVAFCYVLIRHDWKQALVLIATLALVITLCDQVSSSIIKPAVCRLRPSYTESLANTIYVLNGYRGGMYGFVSSHAANSFRVAMLLSLWFKRTSVTSWMFVWAAIVSYSRIYLGVHYPGDIICGGILGVVIAALVYCLSTKLASVNNVHITFVKRDSEILCGGICLNIAIILIVAMFYAV